MKRLVCATLAVSPLGAIVAASSHNNDRDRYNGRDRYADDSVYQGNYAPNGYQNDYRGNYQNYRRNSSYVFRGH